MNDPLLHTYLYAKKEKNNFFVFHILGEPALVLPPHPRSRSSEHTEDITYNTNKMSSTPRAEQFEDRLKTIINSVLSKDETKDVKPPVSLSTSSTSNQNSSQKPMFSPVKKELPTHLPLPPSGRNLKNIFRYLKIVT